MWSVLLISKTHDIAQQLLQTIPLTLPIPMGMYVVESIEGTIQCGDIELQLTLLLSIQKSCWSLFLLQSLFNHDFK